MFKTPNPMPTIRAILGMPDPQPVLRAVEQEATVTYIEDRAAHPAMQALLTDKARVFEARTALVGVEGLLHDLDWVDRDNASPFAVDAAARAWAMLDELRAILAVDGGEVS